MKTLKKYRKILAAMVIIGIAGALYTWFFVYNKPHPNYEKLEAEYYYKTEVLFEEFRSNKTATDKKCTGRMLSVDGKIDYVETNGTQTVVVFVYGQGIFGDEGIRCTMLENYTSAALDLAPGTEVKIKGFCTGYNETDVILEKCIINAI